MTLRILDLFCGAGGAAFGYHQAADYLGIEHTITGIDIKPMPRYPFTFIQGDALEYLAAHGSEYDFIHASPPCQAYTSMQHINNNADAHPDLVEPTRQALGATGRPYVIENVEGAPLRIDLILCGTMFGLRVALHRLFESNQQLPLLVPSCNHAKLYDPYHGGEMAIGERTKFAEAKGIAWDMTRQEVRNAIPPAYTRYIGRQMFGTLEAQP